MSRPTILLVDDTQLFLQVEKDFLRGYAVTVYTASSGREALDLLGIIRPDLLYIDMYMPEIDGPACCAAIKADSDLCKVPVVMVGVSNEEGEIGKCRAAGCDAVITKPVTAEAFIELGCRFLPGLSTIDLRAPCNVQVVCQVNNLPFYGRSVDLSKNGIYIASREKLFTDDLIHLTFILPAGEDLIEAAGRVAWVNNGEKAAKKSLPPGFGVEFMRLSPKAQGQIVLFVENAAARKVVLRIEQAYFVSL